MNDDNLNTIKVLEKLKQKLIATEDILLSDLIDRVLSDLQRKVDQGAIQPSTYAYYGFRLARIAQHLGNRMLSQISIETLEHYFYKRRVQDRISISTLRHEHIAFGKIYNYAIKYRFANSNKINKLSKPVIQTNYTSSYFLRPADIATLINNCSEYLGEIITILYHTGMRKAELSNLRPEDIDLKENLIFIQPHEDWGPKNNKSRVIPIDNIIRKLLKKKINHMTSGQVFIFTSTNGHKAYHFHKSINNLFKRTGIYDKIPNNVKKGVHFLRHSFCSYLVNDLKIPLPVVQELMGHSDIKTTMKYIHTTHKHKFDAIKKFEDNIC